MCVQMNTWTILHWDDMRCRMPESLEIQGSKYCTWGPPGWKYACGVCNGAACGLNITGCCPLNEGPSCKFLVVSHF